MYKVKDLPQQYINISLWTKCSMQKQRNQLHQKQTQYFFLMVKSKKQTLNLLEQTQLPLQPT